MLNDAGMANRGGRPLRGGVKRSKTTLYMLPEHEKQYRALSEELGLSFTDTLTYLVAKGAGQDPPAYIREELRAAENANYAQPLIA